MSSRPPRLHQRALTAAGAFSLALASLLAGPAQAQSETKPLRPARAIQQLTPAQQQKLFPEQKALWLRERQERINLLQRGQRCISGAGSPSALRQCLVQEQRERQQLRSRHQSEMRQLLERNGISLPPAPERRGRWGDPGARSY